MYAQGRAVSALQLRSEAVFQAYPSQKPLRLYFRQQAMSRSGYEFRADAQKRGVPGQGRRGSSPCGTSGRDTPLSRGDPPDVRDERSWLLYDPRRCREVTPRRHAALEKPLAAQACADGMSCMAGV